MQAKDAQSSVQDSGVSPGSHTPFPQGASLHKTPLVGEMRSTPYSQGATSSQTTRHVPRPTHTCDTAPELSPTPEKSLSTESEADELHSLSASASRVPVVLGGHWDRSSLSTHSSAVWTASVPVEPHPMNAGVEKKDEQDSVKKIGLHTQHN